MSAAIDNELSPPEGSRLNAHLEGCPACRKLKSELWGITRLVREQSVTHYPDASFEDHLRRVIREQGEFLSWWGRLTYSLQRKVVWVPVTATILLVLILGPWTSETGLMANMVEAMERHQSYVVGDYKIDIVSDNPRQLRKWFAQELSFIPEIPTFKNPELNLIGGRICYLDGQKVAVVIYSCQGQVVSLFVNPDRVAHNGDIQPTTLGNIEYYQIEADQACSVLWRELAWDCYLVSALPTETLLELMTNH